MSSKRRSTLNGVPLPKSTVNDVRIHRARNERRSYNMVQHPQQQDDTYSIKCIEVSHHQESQVVLPSQWRKLPASLMRPSWHRQYGPSASLLRLGHFSPKINNTNSPNNNSTNNSSCSTRTRVRFSNHHDHRFYCKGSEAIEQFVEQGSDKSSPKSIRTNTSSMEPLLALQDLSINSSAAAPITVADIQNAVANELPVLEIVNMLQDITNQPTSSPAENGDWLKAPYESVKGTIQSISRNSPKSKSDRIQNMKQIKTLLNIYMQSDTVIRQALALHQWNRFEITIESVHNLPTDTTSVAGQAFFSSKATRHDLKPMGKLPPVTLVPSTNTNHMVDYASVTAKGQESHRYCINHNAVLPLEDKTDFHLKILTTSTSAAPSSNEDTTDTTTTTIGQVHIPCSFFQYLCRTVTTQPEQSFALERDLVPVLPDDTDASDANFNMHQPNNNGQPAMRVKFSIRKVALKRNFAHYQVAVVRDKLNRILDWIQRFQKDHPTTTLSGHLSRTTLLHAAIHAQSLPLVQQLLTMEAAAQPSHHDPMRLSYPFGSALGLALSFLDEGAPDMETVTTIIQILQRHALYAYYEHLSYRSNVSKEDDNVSSSSSSSSSSGTLSCSNQHSKNSSSTWSCSSQHSNGSADPTDKKEKQDTAPKMPQKPSSIDHEEDGSNNSSSSSSSSSSSDSDSDTSSEKENQHVPQTRNTKRTNQGGRSRTRKRTVIIKPTRPRRPAARKTTPAGVKSTEVVKPNSSLKSVKGMAKGKHKAQQLATS